MPVDDNSHAVTGRDDVVSTSASKIKLLPPDLHLAIPTSSRRAARSGLMLYTACRPLPLAAQRALWLIVGALGGWAVPGRSQAWEPPIDRGSWDVLVRRWRAELGDFDDVALHLRRPAWRAGASLLLLRRGAPIAFVKLRSERPEGLRVERRALAALGAAGVDSFMVPTVRAHGCVGIWHYVALSALPERIHTVVRRPPFGQILADIASALPDALGESPREGWQPMHGDLTPWNLRSLDRRHLVLFDWEDATWAPRDADLLWYDAVVELKQLSVGTSGREHSDEVVSFWIDHLSPAAVPGARSLAVKVWRRLVAGWRPAR